MRQRVGPRRARRLYIEFLQHLHRQRPDVPLQQVDRPLPLCRFGRMTTYGVEQNIGIEEVGGLRTRGGAARRGTAGRMPGRS
jgi:hypothetical protein